jgi:hypothetical protein
MGLPKVRIRRDWRGRWGVQVKWPRSGPWPRWLLFPRFVWHGPFGIASYRWAKADGAKVFAELVQDTIRRQEEVPHAPRD